MIDPKAITTYSQYNEDIILSALLKDVKKGFYIDVGANYPTIDSVTESFYERGWRGINIEPVESLYKQLAQARPRDINLHCGLGDKSGIATLREFIDVPGHSTFDAAQKDAHAKASRFIDYTVPIRTLREILESQKIKHIHFIKIDVEGFEYQVVAGNDWGKFRPEVVCIEANHRSRDWRPILAKHAYKLFIADGLNEYYIAEEHWPRTETFVERVVELDYHALKLHQMQSWRTDSEELLRIHKMAQEQQQQIEDMNHKMTELYKKAGLTLHGQPWFSRLKRAAYGLTIDWIKYKKTSK